MTCRRDRHPEARSKRREDPSAVAQNAMARCRVVVKRRLTEFTEIKKLIITKNYKLSISCYSYEVT